MKAPIGRFFALALFVSAAGFLQAQLTDMVIIRQQNMVQTSAGAPTTDASNPFSFSVEINGNNMDAGHPWLTSASVTAPSSTVYSLNAPNANSSHWKYQTNPGDYSSLANLESTFANGSYTLHLQSNGMDSNNTGSASVSLTDPAASLVATPLLTLTGGAGDGWNADGTYHLDPTHALSIDFNQIFTGSPSSTNAFHYDIGFDSNTGTTDTSAINQPNAFLHWDPSANSGAGGAAADTAPTFSIAANQLGPGVYTLEVNYDDVQNLTSGSSLDASIVAGLFEVRTTFQITAIPEPATYAAIFGAMALMGVMLRRRLVQV